MLRRLSGLVVAVSVGMSCCQALADRAAGSAEELVLPDDDIDDFESDSAEPEDASSELPSARPTPPRKGGDFESGSAELEDAPSELPSARPTPPRKGGYPKRLDKSTDDLVYYSLVLAIAVYTLELTPPGATFKTASAALTIGYSTAVELHKYRPKWTMGFYLAGVTAVLSGIVSSAVYPQVLGKVGSGVVSLLPEVVEQRVLPAVEKQLESRIGSAVSFAVKQVPTVRKIRKIPKVALDSSGKAALALVKINTMRLLKFPGRWVGWSTSSPKMLQKTIEKARPAATRALAL